MRHRRTFPLLLRFLRDHGFGRDQQAGHRGSVLKSATHHLGRIDDPGLDQIFELLCGALKPKAPFPFLILSSTTEPSAPAFWAIQRAGSSSAFCTIRTPIFSSSGTLRLARLAEARISATPPPGTIPSSTAARV